jgi:hypothetical protein
VVLIFDAGDEMVIPAMPARKKYWTCCPELDRLALGHPWVYLGARTRLDRSGERRVKGELKRRAARLRDPLLGGRRHCASPACELIDHILDHGPGSSAPNRTTRTGTVDSGLSDCGALLGGLCPMLRESPLVLSDEGAGWRSRLVERASKHGPGTSAVESG